jgi:outer membrane protein assembly factor BamB
MLLVARVDSRRVFLLGVAGLVPAALVTLLLVHQPSMGSRPLYPLLRGSLALVGLGLALAPSISQATTSNRLGRSSLCGLAWAGVTVLLCIGPFLESAPRARLYALEVGTGRVVWATSRVAAAPVLVEGDLVVTDVDAKSFVGLDPATGGERWRHEIDDADTEPLVAGAVAAGAYVPEGNTTPAPIAPSTVTRDVRVVGGHLEATDNGGGSSWSLPFGGERVLAVAQSGDSAFAYVSTPGATGPPSGAIVALDVDDGEIRWQRALPAEVVASAGTPAIGSNGDVVVVAGGEKIGVLDAGNGDLRWTESVVTLGKSRGYALPGAVQQLIVTDTLVYLSATPNW